MKSILRFSQALSLLCFVVLALGLVWPRTWVVERRRVIDAPPEEVHQRVTSSAAWDSTTLEVHASNAKRGIDFHRAVRGRRVAEGTLRYEELPQGTAVIWHETGDVAGPIGGFFRGSAEAAIARAIDAALSRLAASGQQPRR
jgi:hypothetical protein